MSLDKDSLVISVVLDVHVHKFLKVDNTFFYECDNFKILSMAHAINMASVYEFV